MKPTRKMLKTVQRHRKNRKQKGMILHWENDRLAGFTFRYGEF